MRSSHLPIDQHLSIDPPSLPIDQHLIIDPPQEGMYRISPPQRISKNIWQRVANRLSPSISVGTVGLSTLTLVVCAVCISVISEKLYRGTLDKFAESAMNSVTTRLVIETTTTMRELESTLDTLVYSTHRANRQVPAVEEAELARSGLIIPLGPSIANESSKPFSFKLGSQIPNTSLTVSTWRQYYGLQMAATAFASRNYFTNFDVVFTDGSFLSLEIAPNKINATLFDGVLITSGNPSDYYVRKSSSNSASDYSFRQSSIVKSKLTDRRTESWLTQSISQGPYNENSPLRGWSELQFDATTGKAWIDLVAVLRTASGNIGRSRLSYSVDILTQQPEEYGIIPISKLDLYIVSRRTGVIFDTPDFHDEIFNDRRRSLEHVMVPTNYELTSFEKKGNCQLTPSAVSNGTQVRTCRHTVGSYGNPVLQAAWEEMRNSWPAVFYDAADYRFSMIGKLSYRTPFYKQFSWGENNYFVSSTNVAFATVNNPELVILVIVPESEVVGVLNDIALVVIGVTVGITLFASILFAIGTRLIFSPLRDVASDMKHAKYLREDKKEPPMPLSRWSEVRAIQEAYRAMRHELKTMKAYIPENVREDVLWRATEEHQKGSDEANTNEGRIPQISSDVQSPMLSEGTMGLATEGGEIVEMTVIGPTTIVVDPVYPINPVGTGSASIESAISNAKILNPLLTATTNFERIPQPHTHSDPQQVYFHDTSLIDRNITVVNLNILQYHSFAQYRHSPSLSKDFTEFITFIGAEAKRFGGVLEHFMGDRIWVSFNATSKCDKHQIAACYFGYYVTTVANDTAMRYCHATPSKPTDGSTAEEPTVDKRFYMCLTGLNCGIATGKAFTGSLGNATIKRHVIISNAMSESAALERLCGKYAGCNVLVGEGLLKHIEGYLHYLVIDALCLPGSEGKPNLLATVQGPTLGPSADISVVIKWLTPTDDEPLKYVYRMERPSVTSSLCPKSKSTSLALPIRDKNMYDDVNDGFKAVLQNNIVLASRMAVKSHAAAKAGAQTSPGQLMRENWAMMEWMAITICEFLDSSASGEENNSVAFPAGVKGYVSANGKAYSPVNRDLLRVSLDPI